MRIERNVRMTRAKTDRKEENPGSQAVAGPDTERSQPSPEPGSKDYADQARAGWLAAQAASSPEIRSERIAAIRNAIANGTYQVSPEQTAEAILAEQHVRNGTAA